MPIHLDYDDPRYPLAAAAILDRHNNGENETNVTSAIRDFLTDTGLAQRRQIVEENPPSQGSRRAVDLTALDTFIEVKRRLGTLSGFNPNSDYVQQLDDYLAESQQSGRRVRMGVLTDGKYWLLRWPGAGPVRTAPPYGFVLEEAKDWLPLYEWLRDKALTPLDDLTPSHEAIQDHFGPASPLYQRDIDGLRELYHANADSETVKVKRRLWHDLLKTALGEVAYTTEDLDEHLRSSIGREGYDTEEMDDLFVRHTYLTAVVGMVVQASFGIDIRELAESDPADLLRGRELHRRTGLQGVLESDFFSWPAEVGGLPLIQALARRVARFDWAQAPADIAVLLYQSVIPAEERRQLGEYYTPDWLARAMVRELVADPLKQSVLDPACGSGAFLTEAVAHFIDAANDARWDPPDTLSRLRVSVTGIDVHPVAVHLARAAWTLAARPAIQSAASAGFSSPITIPVYLGDSLQLRFRAGDMFAEQEVTIDVQDELDTRLVFPVSLVDRAENFDALMSGVADAIESGQDPFLALDDNHVNDPLERQTLSDTIGKMQQLHAQGRDHIWAYYTRNMVRPVALSRAKVDVVIGNPPWINYNQTADVLRDELERLSKEQYGIWAGGRYATHQDVAGLFFARSVELYLQQGGVIGFVMPHSALQAGQYSKWRTGRWQSPSRGRARNRAPQFTLSVEFNHRTAWDLEPLEPNTFFPVPSCVVFARSTGTSEIATPLAGDVERWLGKTADAARGMVYRGHSAITDTSVTGDSPYAGLSRQGAVIVPRCLFFVNETENPAIIQAGNTITVNPRRGSQDKRPWKDLELPEITGQTIERNHLFDVHLGETVAPYVTLEPLQALLPVSYGDRSIPADPGGVGGVDLGALERRMRERWQSVSRLWENNRAPVNQLNLLDQLDYMHKLSSQLEWQGSKQDRPVRLVYTSAGQPTATVLDDDSDIVDYKLFWTPCKDIDEANYLLAIINSETLAEAVNQYTTPNWSGNTRDLQKHLWKLPIPEYDPAVALHAEIAGAGAEAAQGAAHRLADLRAEWQRKHEDWESKGKRGREPLLTVTIVRRELRAWLRASPEGAAAETAVGRLLAGN